MLTLHRNRWTDSSKKRKRKKETHSRKPIWKSAQMTRKIHFVTRMTLIQPPVSGGGGFCCFVFITLFTKWIDVRDRFGRRNQVCFFPVCPWTFFDRPPQFVSRDLFKMLRLWTGSRDTCGTQPAKSPTKENFPSQTQRRRQKNVSGASYSAATWQTMVPVLGLTQASVLK